MTVLYILLAAILIGNYCLFYVACTDSDPPDQDYILLNVCGHLMLLVLGFPLIIVAIAYAEIRESKGRAS
jgi:hypothetical protein